MSAKSKAAILAVLSLHKRVLQPESTIIAAPKAGSIRIAVRRRHRPTDHIFIKYISNIRWSFVI